MVNWIARNKNPISRISALKVKKAWLHKGYNRKIRQ